MIGPRESSQQGPAVSSKGAGIWVITILSSHSETAISLPRVPYVPTIRDRELGREVHSSHVANTNPTNEFLVSDR